MVYLNYSRRTRHSQPLRVDIQVGEPHFCQEKNESTFKAMVVGTDLVILRGGGLAQASGPIRSEAASDATFENMRKRWQETFKVKAPYSI